MVQRIMGETIQLNNLEVTFAYLDDVTMRGSNQEEQDKNLQKFLEVTNKYNMSLNRDKCASSKDTVRLLGYELRHPDPTRMEPLRSLSVPTSKKSLSRM